VVIGPETVGIGRRASLLRVHLDDGRDVEAFDAFRVVPPHGAQVIITEERHASGHLTYKVLRALDH
jgi:hypothetical protein